MSMIRRPWFALLLVALALGACGSDDSDKGATATTARPAGGPAPPELVGTYTITLQGANLPPAKPKELADALGVWTLRIANVGGIDDGRLLSLSGPKGQLEGPSFVVSDHTITLLHEECAAGGDTKFYDNIYRWQLSGRTLRFTTVSNRCSDHVAQTLLTVKPWVRKG